MKEIIPLGLILLLTSHTVNSESIRYTDYELDELDNSQLYVSPTRLKQNKYDTPVSVTRISKETIRTLQIRSLPEVFKYVAGMISSYASGNQPRISYHGTNGLVPRRMQVLINGMSVYRSGYAEVVWSTLPISINDIEAVEITRSPSAAAYGANSMMAVINIKTREPIDVSTFEVYQVLGSHGTQETNIHTGGELGDKGTYRVSYSESADEGFDKNFLEDDRHDGTDKKSLNGVFNYELNNSTKISSFFGYSDVLTELEFRAQSQQSFPDIDTRSIYFLGDISHVFENSKELTISVAYDEVIQKLSFDVCYPLALFSYNLRKLQLQNSNYASTLVNMGYPTGGSASDNALRDAYLAEIASLGPQAAQPWCGSTNENSAEGKYSLEAQLTSIVSEDFRYVLGGSLSQYWFDSETYLQGESSSDQLNAFGNMELRINDLLINIGGMIEYEPSYLDDPALSPRIGMNYRINPYTSLRAVVSKGVRTPDVLEYDGNWSYVISDTTTPHPVDGSTSRYFYYNSTADGSIESEEILAREVSLFSSFNHQLSWTRAEGSFDLKYFNDSLKKLVSQKLQLYDYNPDNSGWVRLNGIEVDGNLVLKNLTVSDTIQDIQLHGNYAYIDNDTNSFYETTLHATHSGAAYAIANFKSGWFGSMAYYGNSSINGQSFDGFEFGLGKTNRVAGGKFTVKGKLVYLPDTKNSFTSSESFSVQNNYDDSASVYLTLGYTYY